MAPIILLITGSRGDVQPFVALARGRLQAGYAVRLATPAMSPRAVRLGECTRAEDDFGRAVEVIEVQLAAACG